MNCPKCGNETEKVKISLFVKGNACSCGWCDFADKIKAKPSLFSRFSSAFRSYKTYSYRWKFLRFRLGIPHFISKHFARLPLYTEEEPIEVSNSTRPKEEKTKEQPLYKIRKRGWKEKRKAFKIGGSPPMNKRIKVHYLPIPMPKFMVSSMIALFMIILVGGYQYVHTIYPFISSIPFLFFLNKPKEKCALRGCDNPVSEDSPFSIIKGKTLRFCSQSHADIYSNSSHLMEYERIQKMYGRRDLLKGIALAGLGAGVAGLLSGMKISEAAVDTTKPAVVSQFSQIGDASVVVFQDKNGNSYVVDKGVGPQLGELIVKANVITPYGASLGAGTAGAQTQTAGIQEAINVGVNLTRTLLSVPHQTGIAFGGGPRISVGPGQYLLNTTLQFPAWGQYTFDAQYATLMYTPTTGDAVTMDSAYFANIFIGQIVTQSANGAAFRIKPTNLDLYNNSKYVYGCKFHIVAAPSSNPWASGTYGVALDMSNQNALIEYCDISVDYVQFFNIGVYVPPRGIAASVRRNRIKVMAEACNTSFKTSDQGFVFNQVEVFSFDQGARSPGVGLDLTGSTNNYTYVSDNSATTDIIFESTSQYERVKALHPVITYSNLSASKTSRIDFVKGLGFSITTPALPAGTGSANAVQNTFPFPVRIYQAQTSLTSNGTHIIDPIGNDVALPNDPPEFTLEPGAKVYYATAVPSSWRWYGS